MFNLSFEAHAILPKHCKKHFPHIYKLSSFQFNVNTVDPITGFGKGAKNRSIFLSTQKIPIWLLKGNVIFHIPHKICVYFYGYTSLVKLAQAVGLAVGRR